MAEQSPKPFRRVVLHGEYDIGNLDQLRDHLSGPGSIEIDLSDVTFLALAALRELADVVIDRRRHGQRVRVVGAPQYVIRLAGLAELEALIDAASM